MPNIKDGHSDDPKENRSGSEFDVESNPSRRHSAVNNGDDDRLPDEDWLNEELPDENPSRSLPRSNVNEDRLPDDNSRRPDMENLPDDNSRRPDMESLPDDSTRRPEPNLPADNAHRPEPSLPDDNSRRPDTESLPADNTRRPEPNLPADNTRRPDTENLPDDNTRRMEPNLPADNTRRPDTENLPDDSTRRMEPSQPDDSTRRPEPDANNKQQQASEQPGKHLDKSAFSGAIPKNDEELAKRANNSKNASTPFSQPVSSDGKGSAIKDGLKGKVVDSLPGVNKAGTSKAIRAAQVAKNVTSAVSNTVQGVTNTVTAAFNPATWIIIGIVLALTLSVLSAMTAMQVYGKADVDCSNVIGSGEASDVQLDGDEHAKAAAIMKWLTTYKFDAFNGNPMSREQAAGVTGNIFQESGFQASEANSIGAFGLFQMLGGRRDAMKAYAESKGKTEGDPTMQLEYMAQELNTSEKTAATMMDSASDKSPAGYAKVWSDFYERPGGGEANIANRQAKAEEYFQLPDTGGDISTMTRGGNAGGVGILSKCAKSAELEPAFVARLVQRAEFLRDHATEVGASGDFESKYGGTARGWNNAWTQACPNIVDIIWGMPEHYTPSMGRQNAQDNFNLMKSSGIEPAAWAFPGNSSPGAELTKPPPGAIVQSTPNHTYVVLSKDGHVIDNFGLTVIPNNAAPVRMMTDDNRSHITGWVLPPAEGYEGTFLNDQTLPPLPEWYHGGDDDGNNSGGGSSDMATNAMEFAKSQIGKPYVWGASGPDSYDCSGLMLASFKSAGKTLPRTAAQQYGAITHISMSELQPGDLVFPASLAHVAMYIGNGQIVHAPRPGKSVEIQTLYPGLTLAGRVS